MSAAIIIQRQRDKTSDVGVVLAAHSVAIRGYRARGFSGRGRKIRTGPSSLDFLGEDTQSARERDPCAGHGGYIICLQCSGYKGGGRL